MQPSVVGPPLSYQFMHSLLQACKSHPHCQKQIMSLPPTMPSSLPSLLLFLIFLSRSVAAVSADSISLPLSRFSGTLHPPNPDPFHRLAVAASASLLRASLLKKPRPPSPPPSSSSLFPHSYGGYSLTLSVGTPPQPVILLLDTGSHLTWLPCTPSYECHRCSSPSSAASPIVPFLPKSSSSVRLVGCNNPKCLWIQSPDVLSRCRAQCPPNATTAGCPKVCPPYALLYGSGSTAGLLLFETLSFPNLTVPNFAVGCSVFSDRQPAGGIAAFSRGAPSIPSQLGLKRFSYCLISRRFDDDADESGSVVLEPSKDDSSTGVAFVPFLKNPAFKPAAGGEPAFSVYYYLALRKITVGGKNVKIPYASLVPDSDGNGGAIIDSGTTFTYMEPAIFEPVATALAGEVAGRFNRSAAVEDRTGLRPCFELPPDSAEVELPELAFHFKGGAEMRLPLQNYFVFTEAASSSLCLAVVSDGGETAGGPAMILGSFQQQDYYIVYDLEREKLGFRRQSCIQS